MKKIFIMFGIVRLWLLPVMVMVMMSSVVDARSCRVDVGRRATKGPYSFSVSTWEVDMLVQRHWKRRSGGWLPGSVSVRCGKKDSIIFSLDIQRDPWKAIDRLKRTSDESAEHEVVDMQ